MKYRSANTYFRERFRRKVYKVGLSLDVTCPNRDGSKGEGGCIFCSAEGSGDFASSCCLKVTDQIDMAVDKLSGKTGADTAYIAYFQSFTSTYCDPSYLRQALLEASKHPQRCAWSGATRPDCLPEEILEVLREASDRMPLFVELGLQTSSDVTAELINRCYKTELYDKAVSDLHEAGAEVITHIIFGLPGVSTGDMLDTVRYACEQGTDGVKFTCLYILKGTKAEKKWHDGLIRPLQMDEYFDIVEEALNILPENVIVHRLTGDGPKRILLAPLWTADKRSVVNYINRRFGH